MTADVKHHVATATRSGVWWALAVDEIGVYTQCRRLSDAEATVRDAIALLRDVQPDSFSIEVVVDWQASFDDPSIRAAYDEALQARRVADAAEREAVERRRAALRLLRDEQLSYRDIGVLYGISHQRVAQLLAGPPGSEDIDFDPPRRADPAVPAQLD